MSDVEDLKATTADVAADVGRLAAIEAEKGRLAPADPLMLPMSQEAERIARGLVPKTVAQRELADDVAKA